MSKGGGTVIGFHYLFGIHIGIGRGPVDQLVEIKVADRTAWPDGIYDPNEGEEVEPPATANHPADAEMSVISIDGVGGGSGGSGWPEPSVGEPGEYGVKLLIDSDNPFNDSAWVQADNLVRTVATSELDPTPMILDLSGEYRIFARNGYTAEYGHGEEAGTIVNETPASLTLRIGTDPVEIEKWERFAAGTPVDPTIDIVLTITEPSGMPGAATVANTSCTIFINSPELFGGEKAEGGIKGPMFVMMGEDTQVPPQELNDMYQQEQPGFRGMFTAFFDGLISSMNPYPKPWTFRVRRTLKGWDNDNPWYQSKCRIVLTRPMAEGEEDNYASAEIHAMNPAHIIYECLTNRTWGRGLQPIALDEEAFTAAADTLYEEQFGLCLKWSRRDSIEAFVQSLIDHIGATIFTNRVTGKLSLKLIRGDYDVNSLPLFTSDTGLLDISEAAISSTTNYVNEMAVSYRDPLTNEERTVKVHNLASLQANGGTFVSASKQYAGIPTPALALRLAQRDLRAQGVELRRYTLTLDRRGAQIAPGDVIRIREPYRGIQETVVRVGRYEDGTMVDGKIKLTAVQDVFGLPQAPFTGNQAGSAAANLKPCVAQYQVFEIPYAIMAKMTPPADFALIEDDDCFMGVTMAQGRPVNTSYAIAVRAGLPETEDEPENNNAYCGYTPEE